MHAPMESLCLSTNRNDRNVNVRFDRTVTKIKGNKLNKTYGLLRNSCYFALKMSSLKCLNVICSLRVFMFAELVLQIWHSTRNA